MNQRQVTAAGHCCLYVWNVVVSGLDHLAHIRRAEFQRGALTHLVNLAFKPALGEGNRISFVCWNSDVWRNAIRVNRVTGQSQRA